MKDEEGFISKENILKIGLGAISALGIIGSLSNVFAAHTSHGNHDNSSVLTQDWMPAPDEHCYRVEATHSSHAAHTSHASY